MAGLEGAVDAERPDDDSYADEVFSDLPSWLYMRLWHGGIQSRAALERLSPAAAAGYGKRSAVLIGEWQRRVMDLCPHCQGTGLVPRGEAQ